MLSKPTLLVALLLVMLRPLAVTTFLASVGCAVASVGAPDLDQRGLLGASGGLGATSALISFAADSKTRGKYKPISDVEAFVARRRKEAAEKVKAAQKEIQLRQAGAEAELSKRRREAAEKVKAAEREMQLRRADAEAELRTVTDQIASKALKLESAEQRIRRLDQDWLSKDREFKKLCGDVSRLQNDIEDELDLDDSGFAARRYVGLDSGRLLEKLKQNREKQKEIGKRLLRQCKNSEVTLEGSSAKGKAFVRQTLKALLRGFNGECDAAISTLRHSNDSTVLGKIDRAFQFYAKQAKDRVSMPWSSSLLDLKVDEAYLVHENALAKQAEREEQAELRRQEREEARARQEAEAAQEAAEREAEKFAELLARAKAEAAQDDQSDEYLAKIAELEKRLADAEDSKARAISQARLTRSGHVYVISIIGSFGHNVFKVGMTRRLEPTDRVRELGDASVPFPFDIHAMIYTVDAPGLENAIHKRIDRYRLNLVNLRREFFTITWDELLVEVEAAAADIGVTAEIRWTRIAEAEQYRQSFSEREGTEQAPRYLGQRIESPELVGSRA